MTQLNKKENLACSTAFLPLVGFYNFAQTFKYMMVFQGIVNKMYEILKYIS